MSTAVFFGLADGEKPKEIELKTTHQISPAFRLFFLFFFSFEKEKFKQKSLLIHLKIE